MPDEMEVISRMAAEMKSIRTERGMTQQMLADAMSARQSQVSHIEQGLNKPRLDSVLRYLAPLGKTLAIVDAEGADA